MPRGVSESLLAMLARALPVLQPPTWQLAIWTPNVAPTFAAANMVISIFEIKEKINKKSAQTLDTLRILLDRSWSAAGPRRTDEQVDPPKTLVALVSELSASTRHPQKR